MKTFGIPDIDVREFSSMPERIRREVQSWVLSLIQIEQAKPKRPAVAKICETQKVTSATVYRKLRDYQTFGWRGLINRSKWPSKLPPASNETFRRFLHGLWLANNKNYRNTHLQLLAIWKHSAPVPGYDKTVGKSAWNDCPDGWTYSNIIYHIKTFSENHL